MTNYEKMMAELKNMSVEEFAKTRIFCYGTSGFYYGDFGSADEHDTALKLEVEWLKEEVQE